MTSLSLKANYPILTDSLQNMSVLKLGCFEFNESCVIIPSISFSIHIDLPQVSLERILIGSISSSDVIIN